MKQWLQKIFNPKRRYMAAGIFRYKKTVILAALIMLLIILLPNVSLAQDRGWFMNAIGFILTPIVTFLGGILLMLINIAVNIFQYNNFLQSPAVTIGWPVVRDLCNMFFVVALLMIAFGTILNIQNYHLKSALPKLLLAAILVNFSKTILGFFIDFAQVIMLTFVNAFKDAAAINLTNGFGIKNMLDLNWNADQSISDWSIIVTIITAIVFLVVACGVMIAYVIVLLWRIMTLWGLLILSPLAFILGAIPGSATTKYAGEFWSKFWSQLTTGIIMAFFLWLALTVIGGVGDTQLIDEFKTTNNASVKSAAVVGDTLSSQSGQGIKTKDDWDTFFAFIVVIGLLVLALTYAQQAGGMAGDFAGKVSGSLKSIGKGTLKRIPGVRAARETWGSYKKNREEARTGKYKAIGANLAERRAALTGGIATTVGAGISAISHQKFIRPFSSDVRKEAADKMEGQAGLLKQIAELKKQYEGYDKTNQPGLRENTRKQIEVLISKNAGLLGDIKIENKLVSVGNIVDDEIKIGSITAKESDLRNGAKNSRRMALYSNIGAGAIGVGGLAAAFAGAPVLAAVGGLAAAATLLPKGVAIINKEKKRQAAAGVEAAQNYQYHEIQDEQRGMEGFDKHKLRETWNDASESKYKRAAAFMELLKRKELNAQETEDGKNKIRDEFGIKDKTINVIVKMQEEQNPTSKRSYSIIGETAELKANPSIKAQWDSARREPEELVASILADTDPTNPQSIYKFVAAAAPNQKQDFVQGFTSLLSQIERNNNGTYTFTSKRGEKQDLTTEQVASAFKLLGIASGGDNHMEEFILNPENLSVKEGMKEIAAQAFRESDFILNLNPKILLDENGKLDGNKTTALFKLMGSHFSPNNFRAFLDKAERLSEQGNSNVRQLLSSLFSNLVYQKSSNIYGSIKSDEEKDNFKSFIDTFYIQICDNRSPLRRFNKDFAGEVKKPI